METKKREYLKEEILKILDTPEGRELAALGPMLFARYTEAARLWASMISLPTEDALVIMYRAGKIVDDGCPPSAILDKLKELAPGL